MFQMISYAECRLKSGATFSDTIGTGDGNVTEVVLCVYFPFIIKIRVFALISNATKMRTPYNTFVMANTCHKSFTFSIFGIITKTHEIPTQEHSLTHWMRLCLLSSFPPTWTASLAGLSGPPFTNMV